MKTQHTPGPWARNISPAWKYPIYEEKNHNKIAYIIKDACISETEQEANLNLIVAAPELLEVLENALNVLAGIATGDLKTINRDSPVIIKARAAIAKARGNL